MLQPACVVIMVILASSCQAGKVIEISTSGDQTRSVYLNDRGVQVTGRKTLIMDIKACAEANIQFAQTHQLSNGFFQVYLGSQDNSMSMIRYSGKKKSDRARGSHLDCKDFRSFWFSWEEAGVLRVGNGKKIGVREFLSLEVEQRVNIHYIVVYTNMGNDGTWRILKDSPPEFYHPYRDGSTVVDVTEDKAVHDKIYELMATDPDDDVVKYSVVGQHRGVFAVRGSELILLRSLDYETKQSYVVTIRATDGKHVVEQSMLVRVIDVPADEVPVIGPPYLVNILEELPAGTPIGQLAHVTDRDTKVRLKYSLAGDDSHYFNMDPKTGEVRMAKRLDRDRRNGRTILDKLIFRVDDGKQLPELKLKINVIDINDNPPAFSQNVYRVTVRENTVEDIVIANLSCIDIDDAANSEFSLSIGSIEIQKPVKKVDTKSNGRHLEQPRKEVNNTHPSKSDFPNKDVKPIPSSVESDGVHPSAPRLPQMLSQDTVGASLESLLFDNLESGSGRSSSRGHGEKRHRRDWPDTDKMKSSWTNRDRSSVLGRERIERNTRSAYNVADQKMPSNRYNEPSLQRFNPSQNDLIRESPEPRPRDARSDSRPRDARSDSRSRDAYSSHPYDGPLKASENKPNEFREMEDRNRDDRRRYGDDRRPGVNMRHNRGPRRRDFDRQSGNRRRQDVPSRWLRRRRKQDLDYYNNYDYDSVGRTRHSEGRQYPSLSRYRNNGGGEHADVPDNWGDFLKSNHQYGSQRTDQRPPERLKDVLKSAKTGQSLQDFFKDPTTTERTTSTESTTKVMTTTTTTTLQPSTTTTTPAPKKDYAEDIHRELLKMRKEFEILENLTKENSAKFNSEFTNFFAAKKGEMSSSPSRVTGSGTDGNSDFTSVLKPAKTTGIETDVFGGDNLDNPTQSDDTDIMNVLFDNVKTTPSTLETSTISVNNISEAHLGNGSIGSENNGNDTDDYDWLVGDGDGDDDDDDGDDIFGDNDDPFGEDSNVDDDDDLFGEDGGSDGDDDDPFGDDDDNDDDDSLFGNDDDNDDPFGNGDTTDESDDLFGNDDVDDDNDDDDDDTDPFGKNDNDDDYDDNLGTVNGSKNGEADNNGDENDALGSDDDDGSDDDEHDSKDTADSANATLDYDGDDELTNLEPAELSGVDIDREIDNELDGKGKEDRTVPESGNTNGEDDYDNFESTDFDMRARAKRSVNVEFLEAGLSDKTVSLSSKRTGSNVEQKSEITEEVSDHSGKAVAKHSKNRFRKQVNIESDKSNRFEQNKSLKRFTRSVSMKQLFESLRPKRSQLKKGLKESLRKHMRNNRKDRKSLMKAYRKLRSKVDRKAKNYLRRRNKMRKLMKSKSTHRSAHESNPKWNNDLNNRYLNDKLVNRYPLNNYLGKPTRKWYNTYPPSVFRVRGQNKLNGIFNSSNRNARLKQLFHRPFTSYTRNQPLKLPFRYPTWNRYAERQPKAFRNQYQWRAFPGDYWLSKLSEHQYDQEYDYPLTYPGSDYDMYSGQDELSVPRSLADDTLVNNFKGYRYPYERHSVYPDFNLPYEENVRKVQLSRTDEATFPDYNDGRFEDMDETRAQGNRIESPNGVLPGQGLGLEYDFDVPEGDYSPERMGPTVKQSKPAYDYEVFGSTNRVREEDTIEELPEETQPAHKVREPDVKTQFTERVPEEFRHLVDINKGRLEKTPPKVKAPKAVHKQQSHDTSSSGESFVGPPLSALAKLHVEVDTDRDKVPMNDFVMVPKQLLAEKLQERHELGTNNLDASEHIKRYFDKDSVPSYPRTLVFGKNNPSHFRRNLKNQDLVNNLMMEDQQLDASSKPKTHFTQHSNIPFLSTNAQKKGSDEIQRSQLRSGKTSKLKSMMDAKSKTNTIENEINPGRKYTHLLRNRLPQPLKSNEEKMYRLKQLLSSLASDNDKNGHHRWLTKSHSLPSTRQRKPRYQLPSKTPNVYPNSEQHPTYSSGFYKAVDYKTALRKPSLRTSSDASAKLQYGADAHKGLSVEQRIDYFDPWKQHRLPKRDATQKEITMFEAEGLSITAKGKAIDFDTMDAGYDTYTLTVLAVDKPIYGSPQTGTTLVLVQVLPVNEFIPEWFKPLVNASGWFPSVLVPENITVGTELITLTANDRDRGEDGRITYSIIKVTGANGQNAIELFTIEPATGKLVTAAKLDRDPGTGGVTHYDLLIAAADNGSPSLTTQGRMRISLHDVNDNAPLFGKSLYEEILPTSWSGLSTWKMYLDVTDFDRTAKFKFKVTKGDDHHFELDSHTGMLSLKGAPDKTLPYKVLTVMVSDGGSPELNSTTQVIIHTQKYSFDQVRATIDAHAKSGGPWVYKMLSGVFGFVLLFLIIFYVCKKYGYILSSVVKPEIEKPDDDVSVHDGRRSRVINIAPPSENNRHDNAEHSVAGSRDNQRYGGVVTIQSMDDRQDGHIQESISSMGPAYTGLTIHRHGDRHNER